MANIAGESDRDAVECRKWFHEGGERFYHDLRGAGIRRVNPDATDDHFSPAIEDRRFESGAAYVNGECAGVRRRGLAV
jgi:hypothetical protein